MSTRRSSSIRSVSPADSSSAARTAPSGASRVQTLTRPRKPGRPERRELRVDVGHRGEHVAHLRALQREARGRPGLGGGPGRGGPRRTDAAHAPARRRSRRPRPCGSRRASRRASRASPRRSRGPPTSPSTTKLPAPSTASTWNTSARSTSRSRSVSGPFPGSLAVGCAAPHHDPARGVAVHAARLGVLLERVLDGHRQLGVGAGDGASPVRLEAVAGALLGHQELAHAQEAPLEPALEGAHRPLAERQAADRELLGERREDQHHRPLAHHGRELREEQARVAPRAPPLRRSRPTWRTPATGRAGRRRRPAAARRSGGRARLGRRRQRGARRPEREAHGRSRAGPGPRRSRSASGSRRPTSGATPRAAGRSGRSPRSRRAPSPRARARRASPTRRARAAATSTRARCAASATSRTSSTSADAVGPSGRIRRSVSSRRSSSSRSSAKGRAGWARGQQGDEQRREHASRASRRAASPRRAPAARCPGEARVGDRRERREPQRQLARPHRQRVVLLVVLRRARAQLGGRLVEQRTRHACRAQLPLRRRAHARRAGPARCARRSRRAPAPSRPGP